MKRLFLSASAVTLTLASMTAAAWWANPYYGAPYGIVPPSPQQLHQMAERKHEAAIEMMERHRQAMEAQRSARTLPMPEMPEFLSDLSLPEPPAFGERPTRLGMPAFGEHPTLPDMPAFGGRPEMPEMPAFRGMPEHAFPEPSFSEVPALPDLPDRPAFEEQLAMPEFPLSNEDREAELKANLDALKQQAAERRAAMDAIAEQRRAVMEQRRQARHDWFCARQALRPMPYHAPRADCLPIDKADNSTDEAPATQPSDQTADSAPAPSKAS